MAGLRHRKAWAALLLAVCSACATQPQPSERLALAQTLVAPAGLVLTHLPTSPPMMAAWSAVARKTDTLTADTLTVYIEGDGFAWRTPEWPSRDPTPIDPVALRLAVQHAGTAVAWLARPCQYVDAEATGCPMSFWTTQRYGAPSITLVAQSLDLLKARYGARQLILVGYSGGGTIAASIASHRQDVIRLVTVAANLDLDQWTRHHGLPPLPSDQNPALMGDRLSLIPQTHIVGTQDKVVPPATVRSYAARIGGHAPIEVIELPDADHHCCWARHWPELRAAASAP